MKPFEAIVAALLLFFATAVGASDAFPSKPIRFVVSGPAGGPTDIIARRIGERLASRVGQRVIVDNRPGRTIAPGDIARAQPDGYTLLFTVDSYLTVSPTLYSNLNYDAGKDFAPVAIVAALNNFVLAVHPGVAARSVSAYIDLARHKAQSVTAANAGTGSPAHLVTALFALTAGVDLLHVPYRGGGQALNDLIGGQVMSMFIPAQLASGPVKDGRVMPLAVTGRKRFALLPEVPTFAEAGMPNLDLNQGFWYGVLAPAGTPDGVVTVLATALLDIAGSEEMKKSLAAMGIEALALGPAEMAKILGDDAQRWARVVRDARITGE